MPHACHCTHTSNLLTKCRRVVTFLLQQEAESAEIAQPAAPSLMLL